MPFLSRVARRFVVVAVTALAACSTPGDQSLLNPTAIPDEAATAHNSMEEGDLTVSMATAAAAVKYADLTYATRSSKQKLDLYLPSTGSGPFPVVLWIHGGGWQTGDKALASTAAQLSIVNSGYALASINYRLSGEAKYPAQIQDVKAALRWLRANATRFKLDPNRVGAWGASAGGHLAALLGSSAGVTALTDLTLGNATQSESIKAVVDFFGPVAFLSMDTQLANQGCKLYAGVGYAAASSPPSKLVGAPINTVPVKVAQADPRSYTGAGDAAYLIQHGTSDCIVPYAQSRVLYNNVASRVGSSKVSIQLMTGYNHGDSRFYSTTNIATVVKFLKARI